MFLSGWCLLGNLSGGSTQLSFSMLAKFGLGSTFANLYVYGGELAPTSVRNMTLGVLSVGARAGGVILPYVMMLVSFMVTLYGLHVVSVSLSLSVCLRVCPSTISY